MNKYILLEAIDKKGRVMQDFANEYRVERDSIMDRLEKGTMNITHCVWKVLNNKLKIIRSKIRDIGLKIKILERAREIILNTD